MTSQKLDSVLCINDNDITLFILKRVLTKANFAFEITEKNNGEEALLYCRRIIKSKKNLFSKYPGVIFLDLHMPVMDGWEFLDRFSNEIWPSFNDTKIVITSQSVDQDDSLRAKEYPFVIDLVKNSITVEYLLKLRENLTEGYNWQG